MRPIPLSDETRCLGAPTNWDPEKHGECLSLSIHDRVVDGKCEMVSAWLPDDEDLLRLNNGHALMLTIGGTSHPVVSLAPSSGPVDQSVATPIARRIGAAIAAAVEGRIEAAMRLQPAGRLLVSPPSIDAQGAHVFFHWLSPLQMVPPEYSNWDLLGPFKPTGVAAGDGGAGGDEKL